MKYDDMQVSESYNYEDDNVVREKIKKRRKYDPLDICVIGSVCGVVISTTILVSRLVSSGILGVIGL